MFNRFFGPKTDPEPELAARPAPVAADPAGDTATVRRIVAKLEAMPPEQARLLASAAYTLARAANADLDITDEETATIERELQAGGTIDEATAVLVTEMAKLQAKTVGGPEDFSVTREFKALASDEQKLNMIRACFAIGAASGSISAEETAIVNEIAAELDIDVATLNAIRADFHEQLSSVQTIRRMTQGAQGG
jgi:tellurite resistance protein